MSIFGERAFKEVIKINEHFYVGFFFLTIWISSFETVLFSPVAHFFIGPLTWGGI
jgi:hypothetical protein